jgi:hypothetical protein
VTDLEAARRVVDSLLSDHFEGRTKDELCRAVLPRACPAARGGAPPKLQRQVGRILARLERRRFVWFDREVWRWRLEADERTWFPPGRLVDYAAGTAKP